MDKLSYAWASAEVKSVVEESCPAGDEIASMTITSVMDEETCPLCKYLDGMTLGIGHRDIAVFLPPLHDGCNCLAFYNQASMRPSLREENYVRPPEELIEKYLAPQRLIRGK
jgi:hypothetical protein